jgi:hypothetical protein
MRGHPFLFPEEDACPSISLQNQKTLFSTHAYGCKLEERSASFAVT